VPNYTTVDLTVRSPAKGRWDFAASIRNLFDAEVLEPSLSSPLSIPNDLPMAPRSLYLQAVYTM
jgi:iron complex outermembrane receptor protein